MVCDVHHDTISSCFGYCESVCNLVLYGIWEAIAYERKDKKEIY